GKFRYRLLDFSGAIQAETRAIQLDPTYADALRLRALSLLRMGRTDEAIRDLNACATVSPAAAECLKHLGDLYAGNGDCRKAEEVARRLIATDPSSPVPYLALARALYAQDAPLESVRIALEQAHSQMRPEDQRVRRLADSINLDILEGNFKQADE